MAPFTPEQLAYLEQMQEATIVKCKDLQHVVTEHLIVCVRTFLKSCDESLKNLTQTTQSLESSMSRKFLDFEASCEQRLRNTLSEFQSLEGNTQALQFASSAPFEKLCHGEREACQLLGSDISTSIDSLRSQIDSLLSKGVQHASLNSCAQKLRDFDARLHLGELRSAAGKDGAITSSQFEPLVSKIEKASKSEILMDDSMQANVHAEDASVASSGPN
jgi:hypothetical protein